MLDVREAGRVARTATSTARVHIPLRELPRRLAEVPTDDQTLVVCKVGGRSAQAAGYLVQNGVDVVNLDGGMLEWEAAGRPMVSETGHPPQVV